MRQASVRAVLLAVLVAVAANNCFGAFGKLLEFNAPDGGQTTTARVGDLIAISVDNTLVLPSPLPTSDVVEGTALQLVGLVNDGKKYVAYFSAQSKGESKCYFTYTRKDNMQAVVALYTFTVTTQTVGRTLEFTADGNLMDVATTAPPTGGAKVGDIIRLKVPGSPASITPYSASAAVVVVNIAQSSDLYVYFSAVKPGHVSAVGYSWGPPGDGGFISKPFDVSPN